MKTLEDIYKNNRQYVANYIQLKISELEEKQKSMQNLDKVATGDIVNLFKQAKEVILNSDIK